MDVSHKRHPAGARGQVKERHPQVPPKVEYALGDVGLALGPSIKALIDGAFLRKETRDESAGEALSA